MKLASQLVLGAMAASVVCATAGAKGTILIDNFIATGGHGASFPVTVDPATLYGSSLPSGSLTLNSGGSGPYLVATALSGQPENDGTTLHHYTEFVLGSLDTSTEQILFDPVSASEFKLDFNYGDGGPSAPASVIFNGTTYTDAHPVSSTALDFIKGVLQSGSGFIESSAGGGGGGGGGGGHGSVSAPEIDPASATSALTLLAGGVAIMLSGRRRKASQLSI